MAIGKVRVDMLMPGQALSSVGQVGSECHAVIVNVGDGENVLHCVHDQTVCAFVIGCGWLASALGGAGISTISALICDKSAPFMF